MSQRIQLANDMLTKWATRTDTPEVDRLDVWLEASDLLPAVQTLIESHWGYLASITGLDHPEEGVLELIYHLCSLSTVLGLRVNLDRNEPRITSVCDVIPSASFLEREIIEMFGVEVTGTPNVDHLYLPDNWPDNVYPLRKDTEL